jgi:signal transduction histidine kinase
VSAAASAASREQAMLFWIHDFAPYGVITTDREFRIQSWNRWMERHDGREAGAVLGRNLFELYPDLRQRGLGSSLERALRGEVTVLSTALHGYLLPLVSKIREPVFSCMQQTARIAPLVLDGEILGTILVIEDVTERETHAKILREQHERDTILSWALAHLLQAPEPRQSIRELFCKVAEIYDYDAYLLYLSDATKGAWRLQGAGGISSELEQRVLALGFSSPLGSLLCDFNEPRRCERLAAGAETAGLLSREFGFHACAVLPLATDEGQLGVLCFGTRTRDTLDAGEMDLLSTIAKYLAVALRKQATNFELRDTQAKLNEHAQSLEHQVEERTATLREIITELEAFSYTLAHDLRAPIRALIGYSEILTEEFASRIPDESHAIIQRINTACKQLDVLTRDLLEFSKVSRQEIQLESIELGSLLDETLSISSVEGAIEVRPPLHAVVGNRSLLRQCLLNLIDNASKFVKDGERAKISIWTEAVEINDSVDGQTNGSPGKRAVALPFSPALHPENPRTAVLRAGGGAGSRGRVRVIVQDNGIGIPPEAHAKIFGIFERATSSPKYQGSGIGLAIVARATQRMGGSCGVESEPGRGSRFWLELPAPEEQPAARV